MQQLQTLASLMSLRLGRSIVERELQVSVDKLLNTGKLHEFYFIISTLRESSATNIDFYRILHGFIKEIMYAENFYIGLYNQNQAVVRFPYVTNKLNNVHEPTCVPITELHNSILLYAIEQNRPLLLTHTAIELLGKKNKYCITKNDLEIDTWLSVPFNVDKYIQGIIVVKSYDKGHHYLEHDKDLLRFVAAQISSFFKYKQIKYLAEHDVLTGLANRTVYSDRLQHCIDHYRRDRKQNFSVLMIDLDEFKRINDDFGHGTGDLILKEVSRRLLECVRDFDTVSRFGGDEFSIILEQISSDHAVNKIADRIVKTMAKPCILKCGEFNLSVSVGICNSMPEASGDIMMKYADQALYEAKASGRNCYRRYHAKHNL
jgi:diguanylate cyclase (GGDEF)-like protein